MKKSIKQQAPSWAKNATPSEQGWRHPKTGELLVAVKLDMTTFTKKEVKQETKQEKQSKPAKSKKTIQTEQEVSLEETVASDSVETQNSTEE